MSRVGKKARVAGWIRVLGLLFLACAGLVAYGLGKQAINGQLAFSWEGLGSLLSGTYISILFAYVVVTGATPPFWLFPYRDKK